MAHAKVELDTFLQLAQKRHPVDIVRVRYWYQGLRRRTGCDTAYQLEQRYDPGSFTKTEDRTHYRCKWNRYGVGKHTPQKRLAQQVEQDQLGSLRELNHPLWTVLRQGLSLEGSLDHWMAQLEPKVQTAMIPNQEGKGGQHEPFNSRLARRLVKIGSLDALTALLLYWCEAVRNGQYDDARYIARLLYQLLLILGDEFSLRGIASEMCILFQTIVFKPTDWGDHCLALHHSHYQHSIGVLHCQLYKINEWRGGVSKAKEAWLKWKLLEGDYGLDVKFGLELPLRPSWEVGPPTAKQFHVALFEHRVRQWAWTHLNGGTSGHVDDGVWQRIFAST